MNDKRNNPKKGIYNHYGSYQGGDTVVGIAYRADKVIQSAEMNELQSLTDEKRNRMGDALLKQGKVIKNCSVLIDVHKGTVSIDSGEVYLNGDIVTLAHKDLTVADFSDVILGVWLTHDYLTELDDPSLRNPAVATRGANEPGVWRITRSAVWGIDSEEHGENAKFYAIFHIKNGILIPSEAPPYVNHFIQAIAKYDRDSTGSQYVVNGLNVHYLGDTDNVQHYTIAAGLARIKGYEVEFDAAIPVEFDVAPSITSTKNEAHIAKGGREYISLNFASAKIIDEVVIVKEKTATITHANFNNSHDELPDNSVIEILSVKQGETTYEVDKDYLLSQGRVDWSPNGKEPANGSTYSVHYRYSAQVEPQNFTAKGFYIDGAVKGKPIYIDYQYYVPRVDRLTLDVDGNVGFLAGTPAHINALPPAVPDNLLLLATIYQTFVAEPVIKQDGNRMVPMSQLNEHELRLDYLTEMLAQARLEQSANMHEAGRKRGMFTDPFFSNVLRDHGLAQNGITANGRLMLDISAESHVLSRPTSDYLQYDELTIISQPLSTDSMQINPYMAFDPLPAKVVLTPAVDRWTTYSSSDETVHTENTVLSNQGRGLRQRIITREDTTTTWQTSQQTTKIPYLRQIPVKVNISELGPQEIIDSVTFDGRNIKPPLLVADDNGCAEFTMTIPEKVTAGRKRVNVQSRSGTRGTAVFVGEGRNINTHTRKTIHLRRSVITQRYDPLAQTFTLENSMQISSVGLYFAKKGSMPVRVQIRETTAGVPNNVVLAETSVENSEIHIDAETKFAFAEPLFLFADIEYAIIVLSDEPDSELKIATLGQFDIKRQKWMTRQPYTVGALLSSSNASTWTPHNDSDLCFSLNACQFTQTSTTVDLGSIDVSNVTDFTVFYEAEFCSPATKIDIVATLPDGSSIVVADGQVVSVHEKISGTIKFEAVLHGDSHFSPVLRESLQVVTGSLAESGNYITQQIPAGEDSRVRLLIDAFLPTGSSVVFKVRDRLSDDWLLLEEVSSRNIDNGMHELTYQTASNITAANVQVAIEFKGSAAARCYFENLRIMVI